MNAKSALRWALLVVVFGSLGAYAMRKSLEGDADSTVSTPTESAITAEATVVVTYFTTDFRCESCRSIEKLSRQAIEEGFPAEVASGAVVFRVLNTDLAENQHFVDDYEITNKTVIVSHRENGNESEWTNRQDVWLLLDDQDEFFSYVREPVRSYLGKS